jgi:cytochrome c biogenesis factor
MIGGLLATMAGLLDSVPLIIDDDLVFKRLFVTVISTFIMVFVFLFIQKLKFGKKGKKQVEKIFLAAHDLMNIMVFLIVFILLSILLRSLRGSVSIEFTEILIMFPTLIILIGLNILLLRPGNLTRMISILILSMTIPLLPVLLLYLDPAKDHDLFSRTSAAILLISQVILTFVILSTIFIKGLTMKRPKVDFRFVSVSVFILGISLIITGYSFGTTWNQEETLYMEPDQPYELWEKQVSIIDMEYDSLDEGRTLDIELKGFDDTGNTISWEYDAYRDLETSNSHIERGILSDTIIFIEDIDPDNNGLIDTIEITFKKIPMTNLVWTGILLMLTGTILRYIGENKNRENPDSLLTRSRGSNENNPPGVNER